MTFTHCRHNTALEQAVQKCIQKAKRVASQRGLQTKLLSEQLARKARNAQNSRLNEKVGVEAINLANLNMMIFDMENALADIEAYLKEIVLPEDAVLDRDSAAGRKGDLDYDYLATQPCYVNALFALDDARKYFEHNLERLYELQPLVEQVQTATNLSSMNMGNEGLDADNQIVTGSEPKAALKTKKGKNRRLRKSSISKPEEKKRP
jgi:hypothetical protein